MNKLEWSEYTKKTIVYSNKMWLGFFMAIAIAFVIFILPENMLHYGDKLLSIFAAVGVIASLLIAETNRHYQKKQLQATLMPKIFELLSQPDVRIARRELHKKYNELNGNENEFIFENISQEYADNADLVLSSFDQVSALILNRLLDEELIFDIYGAMIVREWQTLRGDINLRQNKNKKSLRHFTALKNKFELGIDENDKKPY